MYESYLSNPHVRAFLDVLAYCEGANYNTMFGGGSFAGNQHPCSKVRAGGYNSDAAGRYQFLCSTWRGLGLPDFSPYWQDVGAVMLIARRGALEDVANGDLQRAIPKLRQEWPSLPGGHQQTRNWDQVVSYFQNDLAAQGASNSNYVPTSGNVILQEGTLDFGLWTSSGPGIDVGAVLGVTIGALLLVYVLDL